MQAAKRYCNRDLNIWVCGRHTIWPLEWAWQTFWLCALRTPNPSIAAFKDSDIIPFIRTDGQTDMA